MPFSRTRVPLVPLLTGDQLQAAQAANGPLLQDLGKISGVRELIVDSRQTAAALSADEAGVLAQAIRAAGQAESWPANQVENLITDLAMQKIGRKKPISELKALASKTSDGPAAFTFQADQPGELPIFDGNKVGFVLMPQGVDSLLTASDYDRDIFSNFTGISNPETSFPDPQKVHDFALMHETAHLKDHSRLSSERESEKQMAGDMTEAEEARYKVEDPPRTTREEIYADKVGGLAFYEKYGDTDFLQALASMRALNSLEDPTHATQFGVDSLLAELRPDKFRAPAVQPSPEQIMKGQQAAVDFLHKSDGEYPMSISLAKKINDNPDTSYWRFQNGIARGKITDPDERMFVDRYMKGYEYFKPQLAAEIRQAVKEDVKADASSGFSKTPQISTPRF